MAQSSAIEWTDATWNPVTGCSKVSPGCAHCYAESVTARFAGKPGWIEEHRPWTSENAEHNVRLHPERLEQPLRWRSPRMVFVNSMSDLFHESIDYAFVREVFNVMRRCDGGIVAATGRSEPRHVFQVLTKRPEVALELWRSRKLGFERWPAHIWLGVSIENARHTWRADVLRQIPAAVRFISAEPLLGSLFESGGIVTTRPDGGEDGMDIMLTRQRRPLDLTGIDWLIAGGESGGRDARPMHPEWARELRDAALATDPRGDDAAWVTHGTRFFFKQWGSWSPLQGETIAHVDVAVERTGKLQRADTALASPDVVWMRYRGASPKSGGREIDGRTWDEMPVREAVAA